MSLVYVVDDDEAVRRGLGRLLKAAGFDARCFGSAQEFLAVTREQTDAACLVLDVRMPGMTGLELQKHLRGASAELPIIFVTGHGDIPMSVQAMKAGAISFLAKPFEDEELLSAIHEALTCDRVLREERQRVAVVRQRGQTLTQREQEVLSLIAQGYLNKQAAAALGISEKTVKVHRARVMEKMQVSSFAELVRLAEMLELPPAERAAGAE